MGQMVVAVLPWQLQLLLAARNPRGLSLEGPRWKCPRNLLQLAQRPLLRLGAQGIRAGEARWDGVLSSAAGSLLTSG